LPAQKTRIEKLAKDIKETNEISPIVIDEKFNVIEGQHRLRAMKLL
jgi:ParB-like chromosome segregation protein Spo0J